MLYSVVWGFMDSTVRELIGGVAAFLTTAAYVPQAIRTIRTRQTRDLSLGTYFMLAAGLALWLVYGLILSSMPLILANIVTLALVGVILVLKLKNG
jgi:MtN3 and saliva related transmembrane protein